MNELTKEQLQILLEALIFTSSVDVTLNADPEFYLELVNVIAVLKDEYDLSVDNKVVSIDTSMIFEDMFLSSKLLKLFPKLDEHKEQDELADRVLGSQHGELLAILNEHLDDETLSLEEAKSGIIQKVLKL